MNGNLNFLHFLKENRGLEIPLSIKLKYYPEDITDNDVDNLDDNTLFQLISPKKDEDKVKTLSTLLHYKSFINNLGTYGIFVLLYYSYDPENVMKILDQKGIDLIKKLDSDRVGWLKQFSIEPQKIKKIFKSLNIS